MGKSQQVSVDAKASKKLTTEQIGLVREVVAAKLRYWDALRALELATVAPGQDDWSDRLSDQVTNVICDMAAGIGADISDINSVPEDDIRVYVDGLFA